MANLFDMAAKMGVDKSKPSDEKNENSKKIITLQKRRPWLDENNDTIKRGELKKTDQLEQLDHKLEKIEKRTEKLLANHNKSLARHNNIDTTSSADHNKKTHAATKKEPSYIEFLCLKGVPGLIAKHIAKNYYFDKALNQNICIVDTADLIQKYHKKVSANEIANTIWRMKESGWFEILMSKNNGMRVISIPNPEHYRPQ